MSFDDIRDVEAEAEFLSLIILVYINTLPPLLKEKHKSFLSILKFNLQVWGFKQNSLFIFKFQLCFIKEHGLIPPFKSLFIFAGSVVNLVHPL